MRSRPGPRGWHGRRGGPVVRGSLVVVHLPPLELQSVLDGGGLEPTGVLLRAEVAASRALMALLVRDLFARGLDVAVLKRRLGWVVERRALFGTLAPDAAGALPASLLGRLGLASRGIPGRAGVLEEELASR